VISLGTPRSAGENTGCTWQDLRVPATSLGAPLTSQSAPVTGLDAPVTSRGTPATNQGAPATSFGAPATSLGAPASCLGSLATFLGAPQITVEQSGIYIIFCGNAAGARGNHSYDLSFND